MPRLAKVLWAAVLCATAANARTLVVQRGGSIQSAIDAAHPGDTIEVRPGVYREGAPGRLNALTVTKDRIRLVARPEQGNSVVLENAGNQQFGVWVSPADSATPQNDQSEPETPPCGFNGSRLHGFTIEGFTIRGFDVHGVHLACVDGFRIANNVSQDNHVYGLFPVLSSDGMVAGNVVQGTDKDAGIYVGQSDWVLISGNRASDNLLGLEVENSRDCAVIDNELTGNTLGIIVDVLFGTIEATQERTVVAFNRVRHNDRQNTAETGDIIALLPPGIGILVLGGDTTTVYRNDVEQNAFAGIAVVSLCLAFQLQQPPLVCPSADVLGVQPDPDHNRIIENDVTHNGTPSTPPNPLSGDLVWDGTGTDNCWSGNRTTPHAPQPPLPTCH